MQNFWILAEAAATDAPATASAAAPGTAPAAPAGGTTPAPSKEVGSQPLNDSTINMNTSVSTSTQANGSTATKPLDEKTQQTGPSPWLNILFIVVIFVVMYFMFIRGPKKQQQQQQEMIRSLQKNDRVRTVGGIIGTVVDVKDEYVTLKIDEASNTKIRVVPQAISKNLAPDTKD
jgi:preprotein translocase subunit YajC